LEQEVPLNGSFRLFIFGGDPKKSQRALRDLANGLVAKKSFYARYLRKDMSTVSHHEKNNPHSWFFTICTVFAAKRSSIEISRDVPGVLAGYREHVYADDLQDDKVPSAKAPAHAKVGFGDSEGVVVVRPDGYVGAIVELQEGKGTVEALNEYFAAFCTQGVSVERLEARL
jgi:Phenol hydroxylase, C-terminal dimerisation domain